MNKDQTVAFAQRILMQDLSDTELAEYYPLEKLIASAFHTADLFAQTANVYYMNGFEGVTQFIFGDEDEDEDCDGECSACGNYEKSEAAAPKLITPTQFVEALTKSVGKCPDELKVQFEAMEARGDYANPISQLFMRMIMDSYEKGMGSGLVMTNALNNIVDSMGVAQKFNPAAFNAAFGKQG